MADDYNSMLQLLLAQQYLSPNSGSPLTGDYAAAPSTAPGDTSLPGASPATGNTAGAPNAGSAISSAAGPVSAINPVAGGVLAGVGALASGIQGQLQQNAQNRLQKGALKQQELTANSTEANNIARQMQLSGLRDKANYALQARVGLPVDKFNPLNYGAPGNTNPSMGGVDQNALNKTLNAYTPGSGGSGPVNNVNQAIMTRLGYGNPGQLQGQENLGNNDFHLHTAPGPFNTNPLPGQGGYGPYGGTNTGQPGPIPQSPSASTNPSGYGNNPFVTHTPPNIWRPTY